MKKYELTDETKIVQKRTLYRIKALISFDNVEEGQLGGFIEKEENLSQYNNAWVYDNACVYDDAKVYGHAEVYGNAQVYGHAQVYGNAVVYDHARIYDSAEIHGYAKVYDYAEVYENAKVYDYAEVYENCRVYETAYIFGNAEIFGYASVSGVAEIYGDVRVYGHAEVCDSACLVDRTDILIISPIGPENDTTTFFKTENKEIGVRSGYFTGDIEKFEKLVINIHGGSFYEKQYTLAIELAKMSIHRS